MPYTAKPVIVLTTSSKYVVRIIIIQPTTIIYIYSFLVDRYKVNDLILILLSNFNMIL